MTAHITEIQPAFDFHQAPISAPFQGSTPVSREASKSGARYATEAISANLLTLRQLWREPLTMQDVAALAKLPLSSVCSLKALIADELEAVDQEIVSWGAGRKQTKRTRWRLRHGR